MSSEFKDYKRIAEHTWTVRRRGYIDEITDWDESILYEVVVADLGRAPFVRRKFRTRGGAEDFYSKLMKETALPQTIRKEDIRNG